MTDKQIIEINEQVKKAIQRIEDELREKYKAKEQECEELKKKLKPKLKNAHCAYFEGQTGLCKAKEFSRCNPIGCRLYTIDELSTIVELQQQLDQLKKENETLKAQNILLKESNVALNKDWEEKKNLGYEIACKNEKLKEENEELKKEIDNKFSVSGFNVVFMREHIHNLKQTLAEIKEIAENGCYDDCGMPLDELSIILQKISEVEDANI